MNPFSAVVIAVNVYDIPCLTPFCATRVHIIPQLTSLKFNSLAASLWLKGNDELQFVVELSGP